MSTMTTSLKAKGFAIPSALNYSKIFAQIPPENSNASASKCNCGGCSCSTCSCGGSGKCISCKGCGRGRSSYPLQSLIW